MNDFEVYTPDQATAEPEMSFKTDPADGPQSVARDPIYEEVSKLSVLDAAYRLWAAKRQLDASEGEPLSKRLEPTSDPFNPKVFRSLVAAAISIIGHEKQSAHEGPTLRRLLIAQPDVTEAAAKNAIRRAVHLEDAATATLVSLGFEPKNVRRAIEITRESHPGFSEQTYSSLANKLSFDSCW